MDLPNDLDRLVFFEHARKTAESEYARNPGDAENLTRWGGALLELSQFQSGPDCIKMIKEAITRLEEAIHLNPQKHDTLWCLGNAYTSHAFLSSDREIATVYFAKASECFKQAVEEDPGNELYIKSLEMTARGPELYLELQRQVNPQAGASTAGASTAGASSSTSTKQQASKKKKDSGLMYDICGWVILAIGIVVWVGMAKSHLTPPPPR